MWHSKAGKIAELVSHNNNWKLKKLVNNRFTKFAKSPNNYLISHEIKLAIGDRRNILVEMKKSTYCVGFLIKRK
ncbi:MAG: hypothetical protein CMO81_06760 [Waddliaceae bacterium]|nr:hypothetical protein [Waddliaceae bacterium]|tara:strand:- start:643 stop:864 length:222 start_codon:yes stop_codon:yes gene_type:complete